jgi:hypothetical protein
LIDKLIVNFFDRLTHSSVLVSFAVVRGQHAWILIVTNFGLSFCFVAIYVRCALPVPFFRRDKNSK